MTEDLRTASDLLSNAIASLKDAHHKAANGYEQSGEIVMPDQFGEMVMRDLIKQAHELRKRLIEAMAAANRPII
jgi:uncharacterized Ntn-hydrolase superfamily protein